MNQIISNASRSLSCALRYDQKTRFVCPLPCAYDAETAAYAAARFIRHCPEVRDRLVRQAVSAGLSFRLPARPTYVRIHTTAKSLALPGEDAHVHVLVTPGTVTIKSVRIDPAPGRRRVGPRSSKTASDDRPDAVSFFLLFHVLTSTGRG